MSRTVKGGRDDGGGNPEYWAKRPEYVYRKNTGNWAGSSWSYKAITKENEDESNNS